MLKMHRVTQFIAVVLFAIVALAPAAKADQMGYNEGFFIKSADDDFKLQVNSLFQAAYTAALFDGAGRSNTSSININSARLEFSGHAFGPEWSYLIATEMAGGTAALLDYYVNWMYSEGFQIRVGEYRIPYSREFLTHLGVQQFANRSILGAPVGVTNGNISGVIGRETGVTLWGKLSEDVFEYYLTVSNGNGAGNAIQGNVFGNTSGSGTDIDFRYTGRFTYHLMGNHGLWYSDINMSEDPQLAISAGGNYNRLDINGDAAFDDLIGLTADIVYAVNGFSAALEYHLIYQDFGAGDTTGHNFLGQAGYFINEATEVAARVAWLEPDDTVGTQVIKPGGVINYYLVGHNAKLQFQYELALIETLAVTGSDATDHDFQVQLQFAL